MEFFAGLRSRATPLLPGGQTTRDDEAGTRSALSCGTAFDCRSVEVSMNVLNRRLIAASQLLDVAPEDQSR